ncbi:MAG: polyamine aminopropyltransferase [Thermodesulfobacteriota bacterium]
MTAGPWFAESGGTDIRVSYSYRRMVYSGRSRFQRIDIVETEEFGRMLFLDGVANSAEQDEFIYHEALVHPAMLAHPQPQKICVIGGAEGATLREVLRHPGVNRVVMVDIDEQLVGLCREHLAMMSQGAFEDPRLELIFGDGRKYLEETGEAFDVIIVDLSDPIPDSPAIYLFTREYYQTISSRLSDGGTAAFQGESLQPWRLELHARMVNTLKSVFPVVVPYPYFQPCFHELHGMILTSKRFDPRELDLAGRARERNLELRYLSPEWLTGLFRMPGYVSESYRRYTDILTDDNPLIIPPY